MAGVKPIKTALISVYHKEGLEEAIAELKKLGVQIISTGGTADYIRKQGAEVTDVADLTAYPSILGGRVKTLHPKVFGGILSRRDNSGDILEMDQYEIPEIDLVIVDLYPFEATVASGAAEPEVIEKIDIGGISLIRAAAKNYKDVLIVASQDQYADFTAALKESKGSFSLAQRRHHAGLAFEVSSHYDVQIHQYMAPESNAFKVSHSSGTPLRYGENPHQKAWFYGDLEKRLKQIHGKALSYNNLLDVDAAVQLMEDFRQGPPTFAIFKHTNPCGIATGKNILDAWKRALECDPLSAFGGILICNGTLDAATAQEINQIFFEVLIADAFDPEALEILAKKKKRILLLAQPNTGTGLPNEIVRSAVNGYLVQEKNNIIADPSVYALRTSRKPSEEEISDIVFGEKVSKHLKSNAIAIIKSNQLIGSGIGQTSRVDALKQAIAKAIEKGFDLKGSVLFSDAFFPFADCAEIAFAAGIEVLAEPGGSIRDEDTINFCESKNMCLIFTQNRHFKH